MPWVGVETGAAFQSLMATLLSPLMAGQLPVQSTTIHGATLVQPSLGGTATVALGSDPHADQLMVGREQSVFPNPQVAATGLLLPRTSPGSLPTEQTLVVHQPSLPTAFRMPMAPQVPPGQPMGLAQQVQSASKPSADTVVEAQSAITVELQPGVNVSQARQMIQPVTEMSTALPQTLATLAARAPSPRGNEAVKPETLPALTMDAQPAVNAPGVELSTAVTLVQKTTPSVETVPGSSSQQIVEEIQVMLDQGRSSATIRLQPEELGNVRIRLQVQDGHLHLSIETEKAQTGRLFDQRMGDLRQALESHGLKVGELAVTGGRSHTSGGEALAREAIQLGKATPMEMGGNPSHSQNGAHHQQSFFSGQGGNGQREALYQPHVAPDMGAQDSRVASSVSGEVDERWDWRLAPAGVDYYV
jgi:hypothetical protein